MAKRVEAKTESGAAPRVGADNIVIELRRPTRYDLLAGVVLLPGENNVSRALWDLNLKSAMVQKFIELGHIIEKGEGTAKPIADQLGTVTPGKARLWISACEDIEQLRRWREQDTRPDVREYIDGRIETIRNGSQIQAATDQGGTYSEG
jgi:hypothetical protein